MEESHDVDKSDSSLNESTVGPLDGTFTLEKPTLGVESTPKLTLPIRRKVDMQSFVPIRRNAAESKSASSNPSATRTRPPGSSKRQLRHAPYEDDSVRMPRRQISGTHAGFNSQQVQRSQRQVGCTRSNLDVCRLYMQHLSPDSQRDQSASVKLLNSNATVPNSARRGTVPLSERYALPTLVPEAIRPDDTSTASEKPHALDDAIVRKRLISDFIADEENVAAAACLPISVELPSTPRGQSMPDLIASTLPKDVSEDKKAFCGSENDPVPDGVAKYALLARNDFVVARAASFEYRPARPDPSPARGPLRVTPASVDEWEPRAAKLKKCGSGDQLQLTARPRPAQRSGSACDTPRPEATTDTTHDTIASVASSLASSQSTVDSIENGPFTRPVRLSPYLARPTLTDAPLSNLDYRPTPIRRPACSTNVRQLISDMNESAMLNYDEEVMEHFGNGLRAAPQPLGITLGFRTASPLRTGLENLRPAPVHVHVPVLVLDNGYAHHPTYCGDGALCASPAGAGAGRSAYFPLAYERCTNPVSNILEHGDDKHFIPLGTPTRDDVIG